MPYTLFVTSPPTQGKRVRPRTKNKGHLFITNLPNIPYKKKPTPRWLDQQSRCPSVHRLSRPAGNIFPP